MKFYCVLVLNALVLQDFSRSTEMRETSTFCSSDIILAAISRHYWVECSACSQLTGTDGCDADKLTVAIKMAYK